MNFTRVGLPALGALAYFPIGGISFTFAPLANEFRNYRSVYRSREGNKETIPAGMAPILIAMVVLA